MLDNILFPKNQTLFQIKKKKINFFVLSASYFVTLKRILRPVEGEPLQFSPAYIDNSPAGPGIHVNINTFARLYRAFFLQATLHREGTYPTNYKKPRKDQ